MKINSDDLQKTLFPLDFAATQIKAQIKPTFYIYIINIHLLITHYL